MLVEGERHRAQSCSATLLLAAQPACGCLALLWRPEQGVRRSALADSASAPPASGGPAPDSRDIGRNHLHVPAGVVCLVVQVMPNQCRPASEAGEARCEIICQSQRCRSCDIPLTAEFILMKSHGVRNRYDGESDVISYEVSMICMKS